MADVICVDIDDFEDEHADWSLDLLDRLRSESNFRFKATLFTIPARTSDHTLDRVALRPFLELAVHGWEHSPLECKDWTKERTAEVLGLCLKAGVEHEEADSHYKAIFKAPYWIASNDVYTALAKANWAIADHPQNWQKIPPYLRAYVLAPHHRIGDLHNTRPIIQAHGHFTNDVGNGLREHFKEFQKLATLGLEYKFVSEVVG